MGDITAVTVNGGSLNVSDSSFAYLTYPVAAEFVDSVQIVNCETTKAGSQFGSIFIILYLDVWGDLGGFIDVEYLYIANSSFSGYDAKGLLKTQNVSEVVLTGNTFEIDTDGFVHWTDPNDLHFRETAAVWFDGGGSVMITDCVFMNNGVDIDIPWIFFGGLTETACLSGNKLRFMWAELAQVLLRFSEIFFGGTFLKHYLFVFKILLNS